MEGESYDIRGSPEMAPWRAKLVAVIHPKPNWDNATSPEPWDLI